MSDDRDVMAAAAVALLPQCYVVIDDLLDELGEEKVPRELLVRAKKLLPAWAPHSFEQMPMGGKKGRHE